jgi:3-keto-5-aminohexanoate cleavage enzyme
MSRGFCARKEKNVEKTIITAAVTGALTTRQQNPNVPYTPREIARAAIDSRKAGAAVVHLHTKDPSTGKPLHKSELFMETIRIIRDECDVIINTSTGAGPGCTLEERIAIIPELSADPKVKPEMASLNCGSLNFGILNRKKREFVLNDVQMNPWASLVQFADTMKHYGVKPELEIYDAGMINNARVLGVLGGIQATVDNLVFLKNSIPQDATWSVCVVGLDIYTIGPAAIAAGGHVRVGLEDCVHIEKGVYAESSAQIVAKMARISEIMGREIATPEEARRILAL